MLKHQKSQLVGVLTDDERPRTTPIPHTTVSTCLSMTCRGGGQIVISVIVDNVHSEIVNRIGN